MTLLIRSAMVFFGTLFAAGLLALAEPLITAHMPGESAAPAVQLAAAVAAPATTAQPQR